MSSVHRDNAIKAIRWAADANIALATPGITEERFALLKKRRDEMIEEAVDELVLAAQERMPTG